MNNDNLVSKLKELADEGETLLTTGFEISANPKSDISQPVFDWLLRCNHLLTSAYGKNSATFEKFSQAYTIRMSVNVLVSLAAGEMSNHLEKPEISKSAREQAKELVPLLQNILPLNKRAAASSLYEHLLQELTEANPDWEEAATLIKAGFDYGIPFGTELALLASAHYKARC